MKARFNSLLSVLLVLAGCTAWASAGDTFKIDEAHSQLIFRVAHLGVSKVFGRFDVIHGSFVIDDDAGNDSFEATVPVENIDTGVAARDKHLKSADFFDAKQFPDITFKSTGVKKAGDALEVTGDLTLHGVTKSVMITLTKIGQAQTQMGERAGFDGALTIKRSDFGMMFMPGPVGDEVSLWLNLEGVKQ